MTHHRLLASATTGALLALAAALGAALAPAANAAPADVWQVTIWEDDPALGAAYCRQAEVDYAPAVCHVEPEWMAPDPSMVGWA